MLTRSTASPARSADPVDRGRHAPRPAERSRPAIRWLLIAVIVLGGALRLLYLANSAPADDAYITYRYARNIAAGEGFVYNPGERVLGTTTPLFTLILVPAAKVGVPIDRFALALGLIADLATTLLLFRMLARRFSPQVGLLGAFVYATFYASASAVGYGMEAPILCLLLTAALDAADAGRWNHAALFAALAAWTRPEGFLLGALLGIALLIRRGPRVSWKPVMIFAGVILPWILFATLYFHSPIPQSVIAKATQQDVSVNEWARFFVLRNPVLIVLWLGAGIGAAVSIRRRALSGILLGVWAVLYVLFFLVGRPPFLGLWYFPPLGPSLAGLGAVGAMAVGERVPAFRARPRPALVATAIVILWGCLTAAVLPRSFRTARAGKTAAERIYRQMARWVSESTGDQDLVFVSDIGYVGYISGRRILDASALISPEVTRYYRARPNDPDRGVQFIRDHRPDVILLPLDRRNYSRFRDGGMWELYEPVRRFGFGRPDDIRPEEDPGRTAVSGTLPDFIAYVRKQP